MLGKAQLSMTKSKVAGAGLVILGLLLLWPFLLKNTFSSSEFLPHIICYLKKPGLIWLHFVSDLLIGMAYMAISFTLAYIVYRSRRDIPFSWMFLAFGLFIVACGMTHFMEVLTLWKPLYWLSGWIKVITAIASVATAVVLPPLVPGVFTLIQANKLSNERKEKLEIANRQLENEILDRKNIEEKIKSLNEELEVRIKERTFQLQKANEALQEEKEWLAVTITSIADGVIATDTHGKVILLNKVAEEFTGWSLEEASGKNLEEVFHIINQ